MGIRIHKSIGWGLTDVKCEKFKVVDERINTDFFQSEEYWNKSENIDDFIKWLIEKESDCIDVLKKVDQRNNMGDRSKSRDSFIATSIHLITMWYNNSTKDKRSVYPITYDPEFGLPNVLLMIPVDGNGFSRYDDIIDYYEAESSEPTIKPLTDRCGIYPWEGFMEHIPGSEHYHESSSEKYSTYPFTFDGGEYNQLVGRWDKKRPPLAKDEYLDYLLKAYRPMIATSVILYAKWIDIFKDFYKTIHEFRPMIYTYWA